MKLGIVQLLAVLKEHFMPFDGEQPCLSLCIWPQDTTRLILMEHEGDWLIANERKVATEEDRDDENGVEPGQPFLHGLYIDKVKFPESWLKPGLEWTVLISTEDFVEAFEDNDLVKELNAANPQEEKKDE